MDPSKANDERHLTGGNSLANPQLAGGVVTKASSEASPYVHDFLRHLDGAGVDVPRALGVADGVQRLGYVEGTLAADYGDLGQEILGRIGALIRRIHDASATWEMPADVRWDCAIPAPGAELMCHNDLAPWNLIIGERLVFIDWDASAPSTRVWDLTYAAQAFTLNDVSRPPADAAADLAAFMDGYAADAGMRLAVCDTLAPRVEAMVRLLHDAHAAGIEPWATMHTTGHWEHWSSALAYVLAHDQAWRAALTATAG